MRNTGEALLAAWRENPSDSDIRLVYSDWLEEEGGDTLGANWLRDPELGPFTTPDDINPTAGLILTLLGEDEQRARTASELLQRVDQHAIRGLLQAYTKCQEWEQSEKLRKVLEVIRGETISALCRQALYGCLEDENEDEDEDEDRFTRNCVDALEEMGKLGPPAAASAIDLKIVLEETPATRSWDSHLDPVAAKLFEIIPRFGHLAGPTFLVISCGLEPDQSLPVCDPLIDTAKTLCPDPDALEALLPLYEYWQNMNWDVCDDALDALLGFGVKAAPTVLERLKRCRSEHRGYEVGKSLGPNLIPILEHHRRKNNLPRFTAIGAALYGIATAYPDSTEAALKVFSDVLIQATPDEQSHAFDGIIYNMDSDPEQEVKMVPVALDLLRRGEIVPSLALVVLQLLDDPAEEIQQLAQGYLDSDDVPTREAAKNFLQYVEPRSNNQTEG